MKVVKFLPPPNRAVYHFEARLRQRPLTREKFFIPSWPSEATSKFRCACGLAAAGVP
jgi:hypothetical protein